MLHFDHTDLVATLVTLGLVGAILVASEIAKRALRVPTEWSRKLVHVGVGVVAAFTPSLFSTPLYPIACGALLIGVFVVTEKLGVLRGVHGVRRATSGVIAFPLAGIALMAATGAHGAAYVLPLLVVALADAAAALVGRPFGKHKFVVGDATRSLEGSAAFAIVAFVTSIVVLACAHVAIGPTVAIAAIVALASCAAEAFTQRGWDNAVIPLVVYAILVVALDVTVLHAVTSFALLTVAASIAWWSGRPLERATAV